jgi:hypothetical protein
MQFVLTGFTPDARFRVFAFQGIASDQKRTDYTVTADLSLIRTYGIMVQELPLLCRDLLLQNSEAGLDDRAITLTEAAMRIQADRRAAGREEADRKKSLRKTPPRRPATPTVVMGMAREFASPVQRTH